MLQEVFQNFIYSFMRLLLMDYHTYHYSIWKVL